MTGEGTNRLGGGGGDAFERAGTRREPRLQIDPRTFNGTIPRLLLSKLLDGDPLDLELRCDMRRDERCLLISRDRLFYKSVARCAHAGFSYDGTPPAEEWLAARIDQSMRDILEEDESQALKNLPIEVEADYEMLTVALGFSPEVSRAAHVAFNALDDESRGAYFALSVHGRTVEEYAAMGGGPPEIIQANLERAVEALVRCLPPDREGGAN